MQEIVCRPDWGFHIQKVWWPLCTIRRKELTNDIGWHFNLAGHNGKNDMTIHILDFIHAPAKSGFGHTLWLQFELNWIHRLWIMLPLGINTKDRSGTAVHCRNWCTYRDTRVLTKWPLPKQWKVHFSNYILCPLMGTVINLTRPSLIGTGCQGCLPRSPNLFLFSPLAVSSSQQIIWPIEFHQNILILFLMPPCKTIRDDNSDLT